MISSPVGEPPGLCGTPHSGVVAMGPKRVSRGRALADLECLGSASPGVLLPMTQAAAVLHQVRRDRSL